VDPDVDGLGIYFDLEATEYCAPAPLFVTFNIYLILTNASAEAGVYGWECRIEYEENYPVLVINWQPTNWWGGVWDPPNFAIGLATPIPWSPAINLMTITLMLLSIDCTYFYIVPYPYPSIPGEIVYADGADPNHLITMHQSTGGPDNPVLGINCDCPPPIATDRASWGAVKELYR
jgi:hypothetical protein